MKRVLAIWIPLAFIAAAGAEPALEIDVTVDECERFRAGSIAHRQCRAREARRLRDECDEQRVRVDAVGAKPTRLERATAAAVCRAADRYEIVR